MGTSLPHVACGAIPLRGGGGGGGGRCVRRGRRAGAGRAARGGGGGGSHFVSPRSPSLRGACLPGGLALLGLCFFRGGCAATIRCCVPSFRLASFFAARELPSEGIDERVGRGTTAALALVAGLRFARFTLAVAWAGQRAGGRADAQGRPP
eukprot:COSAG01_NODE_24_length_37608_cov_19.303154_48_plen_151_part_00